MAYGSSSEDEFPDIEVIIQRHKRTTTGKDLDADKASALSQPDSPQSAQASFNETIGKTPATTRRRRKLGQGPPMDGSLMKPWEGSETERVSSGRAASSRQPSWAQSIKEDTGAIMAGELLDRLPVKAKRAESRVVLGGTMFDSPPQERKPTRRLISRGEKNASISKTNPKDKDSTASESDECESDTESYCEKDDNIPFPSEDDESDFILGGDSDSDDLSMSPPQRSQSPSVPRRMQRRVLSSSREPSKKEPTWAKPIQDDGIKSPKKRAEKQNAPKVSTTRQLKVSVKGNLEDAFEKLKIFNEDSEPEVPDAKGTKAPILEPMTPRKNLTASPGKVPRIPMSPWKPEHKEFWDPEVNFAWIDKHSPPKKSTKKLDLDPAAPDNKEELKRRYGTSPEKKQARKAFDAVKENLARDFLHELDTAITEGRLSRLTDSTGGLRVVWSNTLLTTAGRAHWKCKTTTTTSKQPSSTSAGGSGSSSSGGGMTTTKTTAIQHYASIELATKVLSNEADLLNTVAHEFCHLAVFLLHGKPKLAHGAEFKTYGQRVMRAASASTTSISTNNTKDTLRIPRDRGVAINVTTRHSYEIEYRFVWRCADCGAEVCRHSRSVDPRQQRCGRCMGGLVQVKPVPRGKGKGSNNLDDSGDLAGRDTGMGAGAGVSKGQQKTEKKKTAYQEFTSREMKALSVSHKGLSFKEKMVMVSARWSEHQKLVKAKTPDGGGVAATVSVRGLAAAVEVLEIEDDAFDEGDTGPNPGKKAAYDIFA
ncbi:hypothetical protein GGR51DRAFT_541105 [Nemania sp. FL0031]|nr:hypothetical protein GGR51DRAFT_541105 [Nemania sp. FL0031]